MPPKKKFNGPRNASADDGAPPKKQPKKRGQTKERPPGWTDAMWTTDVNRRAAILAGRRDRDERAKAKKEAAAVASMASYLDGPVPSPNGGPWRGPGYFNSLASSSTATPGVLDAQGRTPSTRFSPPPEYVDSDPYGGFNPNASFTDRSTPTPPSDERRAGFQPDMNAAYGGSPAMRRGPLPSTGTSQQRHYAGQAARSMFGEMSQDNSVMHEPIQDSSRAAFM